MKKKSSQRADGRGHWPAGKHRNPDTGNWQRVRLQLQTLLDNHYSRLQRIHCAAVAEDIGVSERSVRRWLKGIDRPAETHQLAIASWLKLAKGRVVRTPPPAAPDRNRSTPR